MKERSTNQYIDGLIDALLLGDDQALRVAQYGGRGGAGSGYAPGRSPFSQGGGGGQGRAFNDFGTDQNFEARLESVHKPAPIDPERNIEKRLESQHTFAEENGINYELSFAERMKLKKRQQIHRREKALEESAKRVDENSPSFIRSKYFDKPHTMVPFEETLESRRIHQDFSQLEQLPAQIQPTRRHQVIASAWEDEIHDIFSGTAGQHTNLDSETVDGTNTVFNDGRDDMVAKQDSAQRRNSNPMGGFKPLDQGRMRQEEILQDLEDESKNEAAWMTKEFGGAFKDPGLDEFGFQQSTAVTPTAGVPSLVDTLRGQLGQIQNGNQSVQQQLDYARQDDGGKRKLRAPRRPQDMHSYKPNGDLVRRNRMEDYGDNAQSNVHWDGLFDDPDYVNGDNMGQLWMGPSL